MAPEYDRLERPNLSTSIQDIIRQRIFSGELKPGDKINEDDWAAALGVSKTPLKMGLVGLAEEGLVELVPRRGAFVQELTAHDELEIYQIRETLEKLAISLAVGRIGDDEAADLVAIAEEYAAVFERFAALDRNEKSGSAGQRIFGDLKAKDIEFHRALVALSGNEQLVELMNKGKIQYLTFIAAERIRPVAELPSIISYEHLEIAAAVRDRDVVRAHKLMSVHLERGQHALRQRIAETAQ
jgi:DNA-binding GntR family transcriptional regulator